MQKTGLKMNYFMELAVYVMKGTKLTSKKFPFSVYLKVGFRCWSFSVSVAFPLVLFIWVTQQT